MIYLHIGVHKTATTYLQSLLAANQGRMAAAGRAYWILHQIRGILSELQLDRNWTVAGIKYLAENRRSPLHRLRELVAAAPDCVISEENVVGVCNDILEAGFFPRAATRLRRIQQPLQDHEIEVWLCLRAYDDFLPSAYCEALRGGHFVPMEDFAALYRTLPDARWPALVDTIHEQLPGSRLVVWAYEDFRILLPKIAARLSGLPYENMRRLSHDERPSASYKAIFEHGRVAADKTSAQRKLSIAMYEELYPRSDFPESFYPWTDREAAEMKEAYRADLADVVRRPYVEFLSAA